MCFRTLNLIIPFLALTLLVSGCAFTRQYIYDPNAGDETGEIDFDTSAEYDTELEEESIAPPEREKIQVPPGVIIAPLQGAPLATAKGLSADIARVLTLRNVRASARSTEKIAYLLEGQAHLTPTEGGATDFRIDWNLVAPDGLSAGQFSDRVPVSGSDWQAVTAAILGPMADRAAAQVDILMQEQARNPIASSSVIVDVADLNETLREVRVLNLLNPVVVEFVDGAPGDGRIALQDALIEALLKARVPVSRRVSEKTYIIVGDVHGSPISSTTISYQFTWMVMKADGSLVGSASNEMDISKDRVVPFWGTVAKAVIEDVIGDIVAVIDKAGASEAGLEDAESMGERG